MYWLLCLLVGIGRRQQIEVRTIRWLIYSFTLYTQRKLYVLCQIWILVFVIHLEKIKIFWLAKKCRINIYYIIILYVYTQSSYIANIWDRHYCAVIELILCYLGKILPQFKKKLHLVSSCLWFRYKRLWIPSFSLFDFNEF